MRMLSTTLSTCVSLLLGWALLSVTHIGFGGVSSTSFAQSPQSSSLEAPADTASLPVVRLRIDDDAITPITARYIERGLREAVELEAGAVLLELDTPGGLVQSTRRIVRSIVGSPIPFIVYVSPSGSRAASAGVFITMAAHVAAMAPATHIGAAHPVQIGGSAQQADTTGGGVMEEKVVNDARAWARSLATLRGRNADWAEAAVSESESITADEALTLNVVDVLAGDVQDLLRQADGDTVSLETERVRLQTADAAIVAVDQWWGERALAAIANPNVAFILLMLGFYGLLFEFYSPGWGIAGSLGALCLLLGFTGMAVLPINMIGIILVVAGLALFVAEAFVPSFGALTVGGIVCLSLGGLMLVDSPTGVVDVSVGVVVPVAVATGIIAFFLMGQIVKAHSGRIQSGAETMLGAEAVADEDFAPSAEGYRGIVRTQGELWTAVSEEPLKSGDHARVRTRDGLTLYVELTGKPSKST